MRVGKTRGHVQSELVMVVKVCISHFDELASTFDNDLLFKDGIENGINFVFDLFYKNRPSFRKWELEGILQAWMVKSEYGVSFNEISFSSLNPRNSLTLWVNHEWVS